MAAWATGGERRRRTTDRDARQLSAISETRLVVVAVAGSHFFDITPVGGGSATVVAVMDGRGAATIGLGTDARRQLDAHLGAWRPFHARTLWIVTAASSSASPVAGRAAVVAVVSDGVSSCSGR